MTIRTGAARRGMAARDGAAVPSFFPGGLTGRLPCDKLYTEQLSHAVRPNQISSPNERNVRARYRAGRPASRECNKKTSPPSGRHGNGMLHANAGKRGTDREILSWSCPSRWHRAALFAPEKKRPTKKKTTGTVPARKTWRPQKTSAKKTDGRMRAGGHHKATVGLRDRTGASGRKMTHRTKALDMHGKASKRHKEVKIIFTSGQDPGIMEEEKKSAREKKIFPRGQGKKGGTRA